MATGFYTTEQPIAQHIKGRDGRTLADAWSEDGMAAYKGTTIAGFPNLFQIVGPNTGLGHSSMVFIIESQIAYIRLRAAEDGRARDRHRRADAGGAAGVERATSSGGCSAPSGAPAAARAGTSTPTAATPRCGRARRSSSARCCSEFDTRAVRRDRRVTPPPRPRSTSHDVTKTPRQQGRRDHRRRLRHRARARPEAARQGALLAISDWNEQGLAETVDLLKAAGVRELRSDVVDVSDRAAMAEWATAVAEQFGRVNMVVNNAGVTVTGDFEEMSYDDFDWIVGVNLMGVVNGTKEFLPHLIASGDGHLVNISSLFGLISMPGQTAYNATKYAVRGFTEALREEMLINGHPVGVTCVHPGGIKTGIARNGRKTASQDAAADRLALREEARPDDRREGRRDHPQGRPGRQGAGARRRRRPRHAPLREARRLALPGRRRQAGAPKTMPARKG